MPRKHSLAEPVHVSAHAATTGGSQVYLKAGETFTLGDLLAAVMIPSANDAAVAVAEHLAGSTDAFVRPHERARPGARARRARSIAVRTACRRIRGRSPT